MQGIDYLIRINSLSFYFIKILLLLKKFLSRLTKVWKMCHIEPICRLIHKGAAMKFKQILETIGVTLILLGLVLITEPDEDIGEVDTQTTKITVQS